MTKKVQIDLNKKLRLERGFFQDIRILLRKTANAGRMPFFNPAKFESEFEDTIFDHYVRVFNVFGDDYRKTHHLGMLRIQELMFRNDAMMTFEETAIKQAAIITKTSSSQLVKAKEISQAKSVDPSFLKLGVPYIVLLHSEYSRLVMSRNTAIVCFNTQWPAEFSKRLEIDYLVGSKGITTKSAIPKSKRWDAVGDDLMRRWHSDADGQIVDIDDLFTVMGEKLDRPGDSSNGASGANLHNCRCSATYKINASELSDAVFATDISGRAAGPSVDQLAQLKVADPVIVRRVETRLRRAIDTAKTNGNIAAADEFQDLLIDFTSKKFDLEAGDVIANKVFKEIDAKLKAGLIKHNIKLAKSKPVPIKKRVPTKETVRTPPRRLGSLNSPTGGLSPAQKDALADMEIAMAKAKDEIEFVFGSDFLTKNQLVQTPGLGNIRFARPKQIAPDQLRSMRKELKALNGGSTGNTAKKTVKMDFSKETASYAEDRIRTVAGEIFDEGMLHPSLIQNSHKNLTFKTAGPWQRANAGYKYENKITLSSKPKSEVIAHEIGHHIEYRNVAVERRMNAFRDKRIREARATGERVINRTNKLRDGIGGRAAPKVLDEIMWKDKFFNEYVGRTYGSTGITEVMSMGIQSFYNTAYMSRILATDPEYFQLIWATLRGF